MFFQRVIGILKLDKNTFEQIKTDQNLMTQAIIIVILYVLIFGFGPSSVGQSFASKIGTSILQFVFWIIESVILYFIGTSVFKSETDIPTFMRLTGFARTPGLLANFLIIPYSILANLWTLVVFIVAIRQGLEISTGKAIVTGLTIWIVEAAGLFLILLPFFAST